VLEDGDDDERVGEEGENPHRAATGGAEQRHHFVDPRKQDGPRPTFGGCPTSGVSGASRLIIERGLWP